MTDAAPGTRDRLIHAAARRFQEAGYHGTSIADVLEVAGVPKGSLYHYFPNGKADLARAAGDLASSTVHEIVAAVFDPARDFPDGTERLSGKVARLFERHPHWRTCPVQMLLDIPEGASDGARMLQGWIDATAAQAARLGDPDPDRAAMRLWTVLIGAWTLARAEGDAAPLRAVPGLLHGLPRPSSDP